MSEPMPRTLALYVAAGALSILVTPLVFPWPAALGLAIVEVLLLAALLDGRPWAHAVNRFGALAMLVLTAVTTPQRVLSMALIERIPLDAAGWVAGFTALAAMIGQGFWLWVLSQPDVKLWLMDRQERRALRARLVRS